MHFTNIFNKDLKQALDENFSNIVTENVGPFLYSTIKTIRPKKILEIGAGYTSIFFAKALQEINEEDSFDNDLINKQSELQEWERRKKLLNKNYNFNQKTKLIIVDNFSKVKHDTARPVDNAISKLRLDEFIDFVEGDGMNLQLIDNLIEKYLPLDFVFLDFGASAALPILFKFYFQRINDFGGYIMVHSTLTNAMHRLWLAELKLKYKNDSSVEIMSFLEPNKIMQNSFTLIKKNGEPVSGQFYPPIYTAQP
jgi:predicted O-methyltransferase YrrM|tara:strand:- start:205 stop:963 length:759 start_codon:yes stop_codon:yes gene_type:complete